MCTHGGAVRDLAHWGTPNNPLECPPGSYDTSMLASASGAGLIHIGPTSGELLKVFTPLRRKGVHTTESCEPMMWQLTLIILSADTLECTHVSLPLAS